MKGARPEATLSVRVQPRASRNAIVGWTGDVLKMRLTAPPVEGAANAACLDLLSHYLDVPGSRLSIIQGDRARSKVVRIVGLTKEEVRARLAKWGLAQTGA